MEEMIKNIVAALAAVETKAEMIHDETDLIQDLEFDSIRMIQLVVEIENRFGFKFDDEMLGIDFLVKFQNLEKYVIDKINEVELNE